jgi:hypothetical protein
LITRTTNEIEHCKKEHLNVLKENTDKWKEEIRMTLQVMEKNPIYSLNFFTIQCIHV